MNLDEMLGIDLDDPTQRHAEALVDADEKLLDELIAFRKARKMTQAEVAQKLGVDQSAVARIESGERDPHLSTLRRYALAVGAVVQHSVGAFEGSPVHHHQALALALGDVTVVYEVPGHVRNMGVLTAREWSTPVSAGAKWYGGLRAGRR